MKTSSLSPADLQEIASRDGAVLFGTTGVAADKDRFDLGGKEIGRNLNYAICFGIPLSARIVESILDGPNKSYFYHYRQVNSLLDHVGLKLASFLQDAGHEAFPVPASQVLDWENQTGHLPHKQIAEKAGLGWWGKNNLIINPRFGPRVRYATVLTSMELPSGNPVACACSSCRACVEICPARALGEKAGDYNRDACLNKLKEFSRERKIGHYICGLCIKACPAGKNRPIPESGAEARRGRAAAKRK